MNYFKITDSPKLKTSELLAECKKLFKVYSYWDDAELDKNFPAPEKETTRYFPKDVESPNKNKSRDDMEGQPLMTLREYALAQTEYFKETGNFLDLDGLTFFNDILPHGLVACGYWNPDRREVRFDWNSRDNCRPRMGARVSLDSFTSTPSELPQTLTINGIVYKQIK